MAKNPTTYDFGYGPVPAHQHPSGGGWVADTAHVDDTAYVGPEALVSGSARVSGSAWVFDSARVSGEVYLHLGNGITPGIASGDLWLNADGTETVRLGCWTGTVAELRALAHSDTWPSDGDAAYRDRWRPSLLAVADLCEAHLAAWKPQGHQHTEGGKFCPDCGAALDKEARQ